MKMCSLSPLASFYFIIIIITIIIIIVVVVVVVHDDTNYWVYLSSDHLFQVYYKARQLFYYKVRWSVITKCDSLVITKCDKCYYKVRQVLQSVTILLQSATGITNCDDYYKVRQYKASPIHTLFHR